MVMDVAVVVVVVVVVVVTFVGLNVVVTIAHFSVGVTVVVHLLILRLLPAHNCKIGKPFWNETFNHKVNDTT